MTPVSRLTIIPLAAILAAVAATTSSGGESGQTPRPPAAPVVTLIGCIERVMPSQPAGSPAAPDVPMYKIMDVQPGGAGQKPMTLASEYLVAGPESLLFSKFQNQWVEVTGSIAPAPAVAAAPPSSRGQRPMAPALSTFTVTALKVVSTECRARAGR